MTVNSNFCESLLKSVFVNHRALLFTPPWMCGAKPQSPPRGDLMFLMKVVGTLPPRRPVRALEQTPLAPLLPRHRRSPPVRPHHRGRLCRRRSHFCRCRRVPRAALQLGIGERRRNAFTTGLSCGVNSCGANINWYRHHRAFIFIVLQKHVYSTVQYCMVTWLGLFFIDPRHLVYSSFMDVYYMDF